jgi:hypothetical protein
MPRPHHLLPALALTLLVPSPALAEGSTLRADLVQSKAIRLDGVPKEWSALVGLTHALKGRPSKADAEAQAGLAYDDTNLYVAADVSDNALRPGGDHVELVLGFPGGTVYEIELFPGDPGKSPGSAKMKDGSAIGGARVVEAPRAGGWTLEASVPWSALAMARQVRVGLRGAIFFHDADAGSAIKNVIGTAPSPSYASLPSISTESEQALADGLIKDKGLRGAPRFNITADVAGDAMKERVLVFDRYLVVLGSHYRKGSEYYYSDLGVDPSMFVSLEAKDLTGDGQSELIFRQRFGQPGKYREMIQVMTFGSSDVPGSIFKHEIAISSEIGTVVNDVAFVPDGPRTAIKITPGTARGYSVSNYREPTETAFDPLLLPWGAVASQTYKFNGKSFTKAGEDRQAAAAPPPPVAETSLPKAPAPSPSELMEKVYDVYKRERSVSGRPRFDLGVDVGADPAPERVLLHDRDIVIFGRSWKGGLGYTYLTLQQFASGNDITEMTARDLTGDGKAEIIVKGILHAAAPPAAGGGTVDREVMLVFQVVGDAVKRVFAAETGRAMGRKKVFASIRFVSSGRGADIELGPGNSIEWNAANYPFTQDAGPVGGLEPLLLPWSNLKPVRYRWTGTGFAH